MSASFSLTVYASVVEEALLRFGAHDVTTLVKQPVTAALASTMTARRTRTRFVDDDADDGVLRHQLRVDFSEGTS
jgi:hypothetical protein